MEMMMMAGLDLTSNNGLIRRKGINNEYDNNDSLSLCYRERTFIYSMRVIHIVKVN